MDEENWDEPQSLQPSEFGTDYGGFSSKNDFGDNNRSKESSGFVDDNSGYGGFSSGGSGGGSRGRGGRGRGGGRNDNDGFSSGGFSGGFNDNAGSGRGRGGGRGRRNDDGFSSGGFNDNAEGGFSSRGNGFDSRDEGGRGRGGRGRGRRDDNENGFSSGGFNDSGSGFSRSFSDDNNEGQRGRGGRGRGGGGRGRGGGYRNNDNDDSNGFSSQGGGFGDNDGGFSSRKGGFGDNDGGFSSRKGGFGDNDGGFSSQGGGFGDNDGGFSSRGFGDSDGGGRGRGGRGRGRGRGRNDDGDSSSGFGDNSGRGRGRGRGFNRNEDDSEQPNADEKPKEIYCPPEPTNDEAEIFGNSVQAGINFDKYDDIEVKVSGIEKPNPLRSFADAELRDLILRNVEKSGYKKPTPVQKYSIPILLSGKDLMACAQTGSGKTAAFLLPIIHKLLEVPREVIDGSSHCEPRAVIISPTRELAIQIFEEARKFSRDSILKVEVAYGGTSVRHQSSRIQSGCDILVATPGRLNDFVEKGRIVFSSIMFVVLDEADKMLDMGFADAIRKVLDHETMPRVEDRQTVMFSATFPKPIQELAWSFMRKDYVFIVVGIVGGACTDIEQVFYEVGMKEKRSKLSEIIEQESSQCTKLSGILVFVETQRTADYLATYLSEKSLPATSIHGARLQSQREEALRDFRTGRMGILVATSVAARGLDIKNVKHVINYDLPKETDEYIHRIGRTGRVGNKGKSTSFYDSGKDSSIKDELVKVLTQAKQEVPDFLSGGSSADYGPAANFGAEDCRDFTSDQNSMLTTQPMEEVEEW